MADSISSSTAAAAAGSQPRCSVDAKTLLDIFGTHFAMRNAEMQAAAAFLACCIKNM
jgi:hypothetical protein